MSPLKPSAIIEQRSRAALDAALRSDPLALARMPAWARELFAERLVVHEILSWLDEMEAREQVRIEVRETARPPKTSAPNPAENDLVEQKEQENEQA